MKSFAFLAGIAAFLTTAQAQYFNITAIRPGQPFHDKQVNAGNGHLFIGGNSSHYCPDLVQKAGGCPNTVLTNFAGGNGTLALGAMVPGGQMIYVDPICGAINYTQPHSARMPTGAITTGWTHDQVLGFGILSWNNTEPAGSGFLACDDAGDGKIWDVYVDMANVSFPDNCIGFDMITQPESKPDAWEYI